METAGARMLRTAVRPTGSPALQDLKPKLQVRNLNFYYGGFRAIKGVNLEIPEKRVTAFIGGQSREYTGC